MTKNKIEIEFSRDIFNDAYIPYYSNQLRYLVLYGGAGSGKSVFAAQKILCRLLDEDSHRFLLIRKVSKTIRKSQFQLFKDLIFMYGLGSLFEFKSSEMTIVCKANGNEIVSAGMDDPEKIKSITGITGIWIEEATELTWEDFKQLDLRLRGLLSNYKQIILSFNPISDTHWLIKKFVHNTPEDTAVCLTTYKDNKFIDEEYKKVLESLKHEDENLYNIYALGIPGTLKNIIFTNWQTVNKFPDNFDDTIYGLDFGFNNPSALIEVNFKDELNVYLRGLLYKSKLTNSDLIRELNNILPEMGGFKRRPIYPDSAEPDRIKEIYDAGFNVHAAEKAHKKEGIDYVKRFNIYVLQDDEELIKELQNYKWKEDKEGNVLDEPVKFLDHYMDGLQYAIRTHVKKGNPDFRVVSRRTIKREKELYSGYINHNWR